MISVDDSGNVAVLNPNGANDGKYVTIAIRYDNAAQNIGLIVGSEVKPTEIVILQPDDKTFVLGDGADSSLSLTAEVRPLNATFKAVS